MKKLIYNLISMVLFSIVLTINGAIAGENSNQSAATKAERVGGNYQVVDIEKKANDTFLITFENEAKSGRYDFLTLESDHVHVGVEKGAKLRISAEILSEKGDRAEVSQVLLFLPAGDTHIPVWMLSRKVPVDHLRGARFLEMHAPTSDYSIL